MNYFRKLLSSLRERKQEKPVALSSSIINKVSMENLISSFRGRKRDRLAAFSSSILNKVPLEIIICIMNYLPSESAVAFSVSCMHLKCLLGTLHFLEVASSPGKTLALLNLLALDLPNQVVCSVCQRLHSMENLRRYNHNTYSAENHTYMTRIANNQYHDLNLPACVSQDLLNNNYAISQLFGAVAFSMAMKRYRQQPECTQLLEIMSSKKAKTKEIGDYVRQSTEECRVIQGRLMHRFQSVHISRKSSTLTPFRHHPPNERICPHIEFRAKFRAGEHVIGSGPRRCQSCHTEYRIDFKHYQTHGLAIFFTRWKDLGDGPEGMVWMQHIPSGPTGPERTMRALRVAFNGSIQPYSILDLQIPLEIPDVQLSSAFENGDDFKFDSLLTSGNKVELFRHQYRC